MRPVVGVHRIRGMNTLREIRVEREMTGVVRPALYRCYTPVSMTGARLHGQRTVTVPLLARCGVNQPLVSADYPLTLIKRSGESYQSVKQLAILQQSDKFLIAKNANRFLIFLFCKRSEVFKTRNDSFSKTYTNYGNYLRKEASSSILFLSSLFFRRDRFCFTLIRSFNS